MTGPRIGPLLIEAFRSAISQPAVSIVSLLIVASMCGTVILTGGRAAGVEEQVVSAIDSEGTRAIIVRAQTGSGLTTSVIDRLETLQDIAWVGAFGPAFDVRNSAIKDGERVPARLMWSTDLQTLGIEVARSKTAQASGSENALEKLGMVDGFGSIVSNAGVDYDISSGLGVPDFLLSLEPLVVIPAAAAGDEDVAVMVVLVRSPQAVAAVADAMRTLLGVGDPQAVTIDTSEKLAALRSVIQGQIGGFGRSLTLSLLAVGATLVAAVLFSFVMIRRKDFGRRRALGASRKLIIVLLVAQTTITSVVGAFVGTALGLLGLTINRDPLPAFSFVVAVAVFGVLAGVLGSLIPAVAASRRDPIRELRVP